MTAGAKRALRAVLLVVAIVATPLALSAANSCSKPIQLAFLDQIDSWEGVVSEGYSSEIFGVKGFSDVRVSEGQEVVGFFSSQSAEEMFSRLKSELEDKGWSCVESGSPVMASFEKEEGEFVWVLVSCVQMNEGCSVVVQSLSKGCLE